MPAVPLTDPELDLLREMLDEDPADEAFLQVGEELVRRARWGDAEEVLTRGLAHHPQARRGFELLARASLENGRYDLAMSALERVERDPTKAPENARVEILTLERAGRVDEARGRAGAFLAVSPGDVVVQAAVERLEAPPPTADQRAHDPLYTVARAERYAAIGRPDRAVRAYRRILLANPGDARLAQRARQLAAAPVDAGDDLSEELTDPGLVPEAPSMVITVEVPLPAPPQAIDMPLPSISGTPAPAQRRDDLPIDAERPSEVEDEDTDLDAPRRQTAAEEEARRQRRRRRSLIRR
jgi:tetratricopeptide (TPR) repeat protein